MNISASIINQVSLQLKSGFDKDFLFRMYHTPMEFYIHRLRAVGFQGLQRVLDAGCGFGQWTLGLSELNTVVHSIDINKSYIKVAHDIIHKLNRNNVYLIQGSIDSLPYPSDVFDGIFCFSSIYFTDYILTSEEFFRVLRPQGKLYICTNGLGWYLYNLIKNHHPSKDYHPRALALQTMLNSAKYLLYGRHRPGSSLIMSPSKTESVLMHIGFKNIQIASEGRINFSNAKAKPIYPESYLGLTNVFEVVALKP